MTDSAASPVAGALISVSVWSPDSITAARGSLPTAFTDSSGAFLLTADSLGEGPIDSFRVQLRPPGCQTTLTGTTLDGSVFPGTGDPVATVDLVLPDPRAAARSETSQVCAFGVHPVWGAGAYKFFLRIDSVTVDSIFGRWDLKYTFGSGDDEGTFRGGIASDQVDLLLTSNPVWHACLTMQLQVAVAPSGNWGEATVVEPQPCLPSPPAFTFVADTIAGIFP